MMMKKIKNFKKFIESSLLRIQVNQENILDRIDESIAATQLTSVTQGLGYLPFSKSSLTFSALKCILNDVIINERKVILEFGTGLSTLVISRMLRMNGLSDIQLFSVEHDERWLSVLQNLIEEEGLERRIHLIHAPLVESEFALNGNAWYSTDQLNKLLEERNIHIDSVVVDGPPAWEEEKKFARYPALPFVYRFLNRNSVIFLDDVSRQGESEILKYWLEGDFGQFERVDFNKKFTGLFRGNFMNVH